jgi:hypothetical protein
MFVNKPKAKAPTLPEGATEHWVVKYPQGRKPFSSREEAYAVAEEARKAPKGWAEVTHVIETVESPR